MNEKNNAVVVVEQVKNVLTIKSEMPLDLGAVWSSMPYESQEQKVALYNAMNSPEDKIADHINEIINMQHCVVEQVELTSEETGETGVFPRIIIVDDKGKTYSCVSIGVFSALKKIFGIFGNPTTWDKPMKIKVKQITKKDRKMLTLELVK
jgi:hypothetical protein